MPKTILRFLPAVLVCLTSALPLTASAADYAVTGGTYGASCNSGGYFTPPSLTVASGSTITFSVPSSDPYSGGLEIHNFPEGNFTVLPGGHHTTSPLAGSVSYYGTWPSSGCQKGSGAITVTAAPTPTPTSTPAPVSAGSTPTPKSTPTPTATPAPSPSTTAPPTASPSTKSSSGGTPSPSPSPVATHTAPSRVNVLSYAAAGSGLLLVLIIGGLLWLRRRARLRLLHQTPSINRKDLV